MAIKFKIAGFLVLALIVFNIASGILNSRKALINDIASKGEYKVVAIDGKPPKRRTSLFVSMVPFVKVWAGEHQIEIEPKRGKGKRESFTFTLASSTSYRISRAENGFTLVEHSY